MIQIEEESIELEFDMDEVYETVTSDYTRLKNKPKLNGVEIVGNVEETDPTVHDWAKEPTRPTYDAEDVGAIAEGDIGSITLEDLGDLWDKL